ncbi:MAG: ABC transporter ATP-binding protein [Candidatus Poribacteria bacterium]|nr:ABC transporter ATP-binding protein [Candidatus Poribacteria bacterium]MDE0505389.1 ABC transporter ATP-binding protein [Candidatus Poribacteria bacterium]
MSNTPHEAILDVRHLKKYFPIEKGFLRRVAGYVRAVDDVSFSVRKGQTMGLVGESGCGKTTTAWTIIRLHEATAGEVYFRVRDGEILDMAALEKGRLKEIRRYMGVVFQDPYASLNPRKTVLDIVADPLLNYGVKRGEREARVAELLTMVGLDPSTMPRYPHAFSGGQRQRIGIARALALSPSLLIADEPVSALDVSVQAQILNLLSDLRDKLGLSYLFIAHDLSVIQHICDRVAVMYMGSIVEEADTEVLFSQPAHPYTASLMAALPVPDPHKPWNPKLNGEVGKPSETGSGCVFAHRCPYADQICHDETPTLETKTTDTKDSHLVACHFADELQLDA